MKIAFFGNGDAGLKCLRYLINYGYVVSSVCTRDDKIKQLTREEDIQIVDEIPIVLEYNPEILLSVYYHKIIPGEVIHVIDNCINFHGGDLPFYKGCFSNIWAIINDEKFTASTAHTMTPEFDEGYIIQRYLVPIEENDTGESLYYKTSEATVNLFVDIVIKLTKDFSINPFEKIGKGHYYPRELPYGGEIDLSWGKRKIYNFIRALHFPPYEGAHLKVGDEKIPIKGETNG